MIIDGLSTGQKPAEKRDKAEAKLVKAGLVSLPKAAKNEVLTMVSSRLCAQRDGPNCRELWPLLP